jgi:hypothetical protein
VGFVLVGLGALLWAGTFDALSGCEGDVIANAALYNQVLVCSALGVLLSAAGLAASIWCRERLLKVSTLVIGLVSGFMCTMNIIVP